MIFMEKGEFVLKAFLWKNWFSTKKILRKCSWVLFIFFNFGFQKSHDFL